MENLSLYNVVMKFINFFTGGATVAPEVLQFIGLAGTLAIVFGLFIYLPIRMFKRR